MNWIKWKKIFMAALALSMITSCQKSIEQPIEKRHPQN
jgi:hypothetical protein